MKLLKSIPLLGCALVLSLSSCSDDEGSRISSGTNFTPDEHKARLEQIGLDALSKIKAEDHADFLRTIDHFFEIADYGCLEVDRNENLKSVKGLLGTVKDICKRNSLAMMPDFATPTNELYSLAQYYGIYTYDEGRNLWVKSASDSSLEFRYRYNDEQVVIKVTSSGEQTKVYLYTDEYRETAYEAYVPEHVSAVMTLGDKTLCSLTADIQVDNDVRSATVSSTLDVNGYVFKQTSKANKTKASARLTMDVKGERMITAEADMTVNGLTDRDQIDAALNDRLEAADLFEVIDSRLNIMDEVIVKVYCPSVKSFVDEDDALWEKFYAFDENSYIAFGYNEELAVLYNKYLKGEMYYTDGDNVIATFSWQPYLVEDDYGYEEYSVEPVITFVSDSSAYSFESYFNDIDFNDLVNSAEDLGDRYESYLRYLLE